MFRLYLTKHYFLRENTVGYKVFGKICEIGPRTRACLILFLDSTFLYLIRWARPHIHIFPTQLAPVGVGRGGGGGEAAGAASTAAGALGRSWTGM